MRRTPSIVSGGNASPITKMRRSVVHDSRSTWAANTVSIDGTKSVIVTFSRAMTSAT